MEIADWKKLFAPRILSRGEEYYDSELVEIEAMDSSTGEPAEDPGRCHGAFS